MTEQEFDDLWHSLTEKQKQRVRDKAKWEHIGVWAVLKEWPDIWRDE